MLNLKLDSICRISILMYICSLFALKEYRIFFEIIYLLSALIYFVKHKKTITIYTIWNFIFLLLSISSILWSRDIKSSILASRSILEIGVICNLLISYLDKEEKIEYIYKCFYISGSVQIVKMLLTYPISMWGSERLGDTLYNPNTLATQLVISSLCALQVAKHNKNILPKISILIFFIVILLTGSRKSLFAYILGLSILYIKESRKISIKYIKILNSILIIFLVYNIVMANPELYNLVGVRIEGLINLIAGNGKIDNSTSVRMSMIDIGIELIKEKPILGYGISSYASVSGLSLYSHNNYIELLCGVGIVGAILYYSIYIYIYYHITMNKNANYNIVLAFIIIFLVCDVGQVSYYVEMYQICIAVSIAIIRNTNKSKYIINKCKG